MKIAILFLSLTLVGCVGCGRKQGQPPIRVDDGPIDAGRYAETTAVALPVKTFTCEGCRAYENEIYPRPCKNHEEEVWISDDRGDEPACVKSVVKLNPHKR